MCQFCADPVHRTPTSGAASPSTRRDVLVGAGAALVASTFAARPVLAQTTVSGPVPTIGYAAMKEKAPLSRFTFERREPRPDDVLIDLLYVGICRSDIHAARNDFGQRIYPVVPGHEMVGRVAYVGRSVTRFKVGDLAGVGAMVDSCGVCDPCKRGLEQYCEKNPTLTYGSRDADGQQTFGGYSNRIVVKEHFVIKLPDGIDLVSAAPLLCAGLTTYSPLQHWHVSEGQRVGIVGLGGLGHMALKLTVARGAEATVFTTTPEKVDDAKRMGAREVVVWPDAAAFSRLQSQFDFILSTVPEAYDVNPFVNLLRFDGVMANIGLGQKVDIEYLPVNFRRRSLVGSLIGGIPETQELVDYCAARNIRPEVQVIPISQVNEAYDRVVNKDIKFRFVIDLSTLT
jgi:uncharacterized zinc-type alcohol dehydrogenase-like protein